MDHESVQILLDRYLTGTCSREEQLHVEAWLEQQEVEVNEWTTMDTAEKAAWMASLYQDIRVSTATTAQPEQEQEPQVIPLYRRTYFRVAAAAAIILLIGSVAYLYYNRTPKNEPVIAEKEQSVPHDVAPGGNKAILTLADNSTIVLDSAANGQLAQQGKTTVIKSGEGQLSYSSSTGVREGAVLYNTLATPRGGQYQLVLPDGSKVWLNAASSIRYPTAFAGNERKVEITGEAYFEVAKNPKKPFIVNILPPTGGAGGGRIEVLGTHFNINAYDDEPAIKTTLLEGSVKVVNRQSSMGNEQSAILKPGQQAVIAANSPLTTHHSPDLDQVVAWKNGRFYFENADIQTIMRQVSRWYDVTIVYEGKIPAGHYRGKPAMNLTAAQMLKIVEYSGVDIRIEGKKIIVKE